ncbi:hypothetical protein [uncultured Sphingomonas sp.]|uniref:hypothetical protein n=1 Tax=uncultured Sphingomonas sp. TaxID=158754 RepID=UPI002596816E|nr:hypothetical protein [uncultured Sphingomonas sp.]
MAAEAQRATRSRDQGSFAQRPPRMPVPKDSFAATFSLSRRRGVDWVCPSFAEMDDATEELLDRLDRISAGIAAVAQNAADDLERTDGTTAYSRALEQYLLLEGVRDQMLSIRLIAHGINERAYRASVSA